MPRFTDKTISEIKNRISIKDLMSEYAYVEARGSNKYWAKCPFHGGGNERTPSCMLNLELGRYYCFGCHEAGDIFTLVMKKEGLDFTGAVEYLARKAHVELEESTESDKVKKSEKDMLYDLNSRLNNTFVFYLKESKEGERAREYLRKRKVSAEMIDKFSLGYAPSNTDFLYSFLQKKGYSAEFLQKAGLFSQKKPRWPLFADRLMFPIRDRQGRIIAFSGRDLSGSDKAPKYINSPETFLYQKKESFFGLYEAKKTISSGNWPILCEGNFDVVAMHQAGFTEALASLGTAFTEEQGMLIKKWFPAITGFNLLFDSDEAGQKSTERAILILNKIGFSVKVHRLQSASELLEKKGKEGVEKEFGNYLDGFEYLVQNNSSRYDILSAKGKSGFIKAMGSFIMSCQSQVERDSYILQLATKLNASEEAVKEELNRTSSGSPAKEEELTAGNIRDRSISIDLFLMLYFANHRRDFKNEYRRRISFNDLEDNEAQIIYAALENAIRNGVESDDLFLTLISDDKCRKEVATTFALDEYKERNEDAVEEAVSRIALRSLEKKRALINSQLRLYNGMLGNDEMDELLRSKAEIDKDILVLKRNMNAISQ